jgi:hypothetical protein
MVHQGSVSSVAFSPDGTHWLSGLMTAADIPVLRPMRATSWPVAASQMRAVLS